MITFLASPKAFVGPAEAIQKNAISSWQKVHPDAEVIIFGDSAGAAAACIELGAQHVPNVPCSPSGVPYFNGIVEYAKVHARHDIQVYLNCDILIHKTILSAIACIAFTHYLIVGQRIDLAEDVQLSITSDQWKDELRQLAGENKTVLHAPSGVDYFVFVRGMWQELPPLVIGRGGYDGALVAFCLRRGIPLIDGTYAIPAIHQFHDYGHVSGGQHLVIEGEDATNNCTLHNIKHSTPNSADAEWQIMRGKLIRSYGRSDWLRRIELHLRFVRGWDTLGLTPRLLWRLLVSCKLYHLNTPDIYDVLDSY